MAGHSWHIEDDIDAPLRLTRLLTEYGWDNVKLEIMWCPLRPEMVDSGNNPMTDIAKDKQRDTARLFQRLYGEAGLLEKQCLEFFHTDTHTSPFAYNAPEVAVFSAESFQAAKDLVTAAERELADPNLRAYHPA
jgi:hypothetical protein